MYRGGNVRRAVASVKIPTLNKRVNREIESMKPCPTSLTFNRSEVKFFMRAIDSTTANLFLQFYRTVC
jgi:hypothetical protein